MRVVGGADGHSNHCQDSLIQQLALIPELQVISTTEDSPSGLWRSLGKRVG